MSFDTWTGECGSQARQQPDGRGSLLHPEPCHDRCHDRYPRRSPAARSTARAPARCSRRPSRPLSGAPHSTVLTRSPSSSGRRITSCSPRLAGGLGANPAVQLTSVPAVGDAVPIGAVPVPADRRILLTVRPAMNTTYRLGYSGTSTIAPSQADALVLVRRSVALVGVSASGAAPARVGRSVQVVASISPATAGVPVSMRHDPGRRLWVYAGSRGRTSDATGRVSTTWTPTSAGAYYWRAAAASTVDFANNVSPVYRWSVTR